MFENVKMRPIALTIVAICLALAVGAPCPTRASSQAAAVTETELNTAKQRLPLLRYFMREREALDLLGLSRFYRPSPVTTCSDSRSQPCELGDGHWLVLWYSETTLPDPLRYGLRYASLDDDAMIQVDNGAWSEIQNALRYGHAPTALSVAPTGVPQFELTKQDHTNVWLTVALTNNTPWSLSVSLGVVRITELINDVPFTGKLFSTRVDLAPFGTTLATVGYSQDMLKSQCVLGAEYARGLSITGATALGAQTNADWQKVFVGRIQQR